MAEYIERDDLKFPYMTMTLWGLNHETCHAYNEGMKAAADYIASLPAADVVEVVRCKDCKHYQKDMLFGAAYCDGRKVKPDDFCSYGERRDTDG